MFCHHPGLQPSCMPPCLCRRLTTISVRHQPVALAAKLIPFVTMKVRHQPVGRQTQVVPSPRQFVNNLFATKPKLFRHYVGSPPTSSPPNPSCFITDHAGQFRTNQFVTKPKSFRLRVSSPPNSSPPNPSRFVNTSVCC